MTDLPTLRAARDAAKKAYEYSVMEIFKRLYGNKYVGNEHFADKDKALDTLLRLHAQVTTLENAEKLEQHRAENLMGRTQRRYGFAAAARFLRATVEGA